MKVRYAKKSEKEIAIKFWKDSFKDNEEQIKFYFDSIYNEKNYLVLEDNSKIVSSLHENDYIFNFNNNSLKSKYIVGISSDITMRNKGYMSKLLISMLKNSKRKGLPFVFLTPINPKIYRKFGFEYFSNIEYYNFSVEELTNFKLPKENYSYIEINEENKNLYLNDLIKIYNFNMKDNFCYLERDKFYFDKILKEAISDEMKAFILYKDKKASAYIILGLYEENIEIRECMALDSISYKEILTLIYGYRNYYKNVSLASPNNSSIEFLFDNQLNIEKNVKPFMMMRVLNPLAIFKNLKLENSNIKIYIEDKILKENTGLYSLNNEISFSNMTEEKASYDLKIDIADLIFLITGYFFIDELIKLGKIDIKNRNIFKKINKIFSKKNSYLYEFI
ncbi:GNAT family N-acetyltransferase [Fusobacterium nucleatum subsp. nucleatum ATCC 25586]|uniref:Acetyltransferase n=2 Tax=Fusobacterium nucleatum subsp. nucleatum TaxID=76856 RepID=Q8R651_FUSNN|nr:enhanced intracellular survival protein Eis [Fusobacterium nucleatum]AAL95237.1 Acetyltransferase [Fusobacterium nucleatum subsp. nucleatum ATCC 25586]ALF24439.1 acetyltransferase [Fusobacterium nucleatum subsp. nucleatum ChDC F316]ASG26293.1 GNAT family N-acetyltransferase [Fusobacterium nucleatum subsp. nucleatum]AVQ15396.1 GNAT family N-acetyltransferase [Fusobacterium nucleatum subsp. nucleatum ATCC 25586]KUL98821.1 acetyltransferase [Fusobacterium nucleatum subsp. nucleatum]